MQEKGKNNCGNQSGDNTDRYRSRHVIFSFKETMVQQQQWGRAPSGGGLEKEQTGPQGSNARGSQVFLKVKEVWE